MSATEGLVDAHCHVDLFPEPAQLLRRLHEDGMHVVTVTNIPTVFRPNVDLAARYPQVHVALGLHPELVHSHAHELDKMHALLPEARFVGEVGLDYKTPHDAERAAQRRVFETVLRWCADAKDKVLTVHSRRAADDVISMIGTEYPCPAILHWFSGTSKQVQRATAAGLYFSVNAAMVRTEKGATLVAQMDPDRVLTESDGPFLRVGGIPAEPTSVIQVVEHLATVWRCTYDGAKDRILGNFERITKAEVD